MADTLEAQMAECIMTKLGDREFRLECYDDGDWQASMGDIVANGRTATDVVAVLRRKVMADRENKLRRLCG